MEWVKHLFAKTDNFKKNMFFIVLLFFIVLVSWLYFSKYL